MRYQIDLTEEQEKALIQFARKTHHDYWRGLLICGGVFALCMYAMAKYSIFSSESIILSIISGSGFIALFVNGIGLDFGINCDYACLKHGKYTIDFRKSAGKLPDNGNKKYYVTDGEGNQYRCLKFLDYRSSEQGKDLLCIHLQNGRHYAFPEEENLMI